MIENKVLCMSTGYNIIHSNIPTEMKQHKAWCNWHVNPADSSKIPLNAWKLNKNNWADSSTRLRINNVNEYATFGQVMHNRDAFTGIGYIANVKNSVVLVDLDHCIYNGVPYAWAEDIVNALNSYTEVSVSGTGLHIWLYSKPVGSCRKSDDNGRRIEVYDSGHYGIVNGRSYHAEPLPLREATAELREIIYSFGQQSTPEAYEKAQRKNYILPVSDEAVLKKMFSSRYGDNLRKLYEGDISYYPSHSEADAGLIRNLAYWTGWDRAQTDRLFRSSALMRDKWDKVHDRYGRTYGQATIDAVFSRR